MPTFSEQEITHSPFSGVTAPVNISDEAKAYLVEPMTDLNYNAAWKTQNLAPNSVSPGLLTGTEFGTYFVEAKAVYCETLKEVGLIN
ncbi:hypothetical protein [Dinoroseobacter sp. S76]|uniref:hypothetical protein n=1 Tax=Dinoroseobacter sp. S76 TaxID=3415124 RepID=UPI003C7DD02B